MHTFSYNFFYFTFKTESRRTQIEINIIQEKIQMEEIKLEKYIYNIYVYLFIYLFWVGGLISQATAICIFTYKKYKIVSFEKMMTAFIFPF